MMTGNGPARGVVCPEAGKRPRRGTKSTAKTAVSGNLSLKNTLPNPTIFLPPANQAPAQSFPRRDRSETQAKRKNEAWHIDAPQFGQSFRISNFASRSTVAHIADTGRCGSQPPRAL